MTLLRINNSVIYYNWVEPSCVSDYFTYILSLTKQFVSSYNYGVNIIFGHDAICFDNNNPTIRIGCNFEHTLVKRGGRGADGAIIGNIPVLQNMSECYLVRLDNFTNLSLCDIVIDYSNPNIENVRAANVWKNYYCKLLYIAPHLYNDGFIKENRDIPILTTFLNTNEPRRRLLLDTISRYSLQHTNINNCFEYKELQCLYKRTKILINIHQTDHHCTFEELRVLPALLCGAIVISEYSPLYELVPYHECIIWSSYENILNVVMDVHDNFDKYYERVFNMKNIDKMNSLLNDNRDAFNNRMHSLLEIEPAGLPFK